MRVIAPSTAALPREVDPGAALTAADAYRSIRMDGTTAVADPVLNQLRERLRDRLAQREAAGAEIDALHAGVSARGDINLNADEQAKHADLMTRVASLDAEILGTDDQPGLQKRIDDHVAERARREQFASMSAALDIAPPDGAAPDVRGDITAGSTEVTPAGGLQLAYTGDEQVYRTGEHDFLQDAYQAFRGAGGDAAERIVRSTKRELDVAKRSGKPITQGGAAVDVRDVTTGSFVNLVIPEYLVSEAAAVARSGAPIASVLRTIPLPPKGMTVNTSRQTTGTAAGAQASEGAAPTETDQVWAAYNIPVVTITGKQDISRQSIDRGEAIGSLTLGDLVDAYYEDLDAQLANGSTGSGEHQGLLQVAGIGSVTYTDASPTATELWPKLANALSDVASNRKRPATHWLMHPRRFAFLLAETDTQGRPIVVPQAFASNPMGVGEVPTVGVGYTLMGLPIVQSPNIPTDLGGGTEDRILAIRATDSPLLWENGGVPRTMTFDMLSAEEVTVAVWGYSAFGSGRYPTSIAAISGTGLVTPTF